jgi:hypothetical protein
VVAALSLCLILVIWIKTGLTQTWSVSTINLWNWITIEDTYEKKDGKIDTNKSYSKIITPTWDITMYGSLLSSAWQWIWYIIISLFTCFLLWTVMKAWFMTSDIAKTVSDPIFKSVENMVQAQEILPWGVSIAWIKNIPAGLSSATESVKNQSTNEVESSIDKFFKTDWNDISTSDVASFKTMWDFRSHSQTKIFFDKLKWTVNGKDITFNSSPRFGGALRVWFDRGWKNYLTKFGPPALRALINKDWTTSADILKSTEFQAWVKLVIANSWTYDYEISIWSQEGGINTEFTRIKKLKAIWDKKIW